MKNPITLDNIVEESERLGGRVLSAPLVGYNKAGELRYITAWDVHTTEKGDDNDDDNPFSAIVTSARIVFKFGDIASI